LAAAGANTVSLVLAVVLAVGVVVLVALPFLREPVVEDDRLDAPTPAEEERLALLDERDRALAALKELEFDHRTGKIGDDDYRELIGPQRRAAAAALRALERYGPGMETPDLPPEPAPPPDEGTPPQPAEVPEPYPPPDEITIPQE
jgi:hypothetical protein